MQAAELACQCRALGLSTSDLAEIGGVSERSARNWLLGRDSRGYARNVPNDVTEAIADLDDDLGVFEDAMIADVDEGSAIILVHRTNEELRAAHPKIPGRGKAPGPFVGVEMIAALSAQHFLLSEKGIEVEIMWA